MTSSMVTVTWLVLIGALIGGAVGSVMVVMLRTLLSLATPGAG